MIASGPLLVAVGAVLSLSACNRTPSAVTDASQTTIASPAATSVVTTTPASPSAPRPSASVSATEVPLPEWSHWGTLPPTPQPSTCGRAWSMNGTSGGRASLVCFAKAVARCAPASLNYTTSGIDAGTDARLTMLPGSPCRARYAWNGWMASFDGLTGPTTTVDCPVSVVGAVIVLGCPDLPEVIPAR